MDRLDKPSDTERYFVEEQIEDLHALFNNWIGLILRLSGIPWEDVSISYTAKYPVDIINIRK